MAWIALAIVVTGCQRPRWADSGLPKLITDQAMHTVSDEEWRGKNSGHTAGGHGHGGDGFVKQSFYGEIHGRSETTDSLLEKIHTQTLTIIDQRGGVVTGRSERRGSNHSYRGRFGTSQSGNSNEDSSQPLSGFALEYAWKSNYGLIDAHTFQDAEGNYQIVLNCSEHQR
ncbi:hypothetical protein GC163_01340 [bacterium]|nr:hypothetical protein [bacterium]